MVTIMMESTALLITLTIMLTIGGLYAVFAVSCGFIDHSFDWQNKNRFCLLLLFFAPVVVAVLYLGGPISPGW